MLVACSFVACTGDASVGCSPSLSCSYNPAAFDPPLQDAGPRFCGLRCRAATIAAGAAHTCAVAEGGEVLCWGSNEDGQRGPAAPADIDAGAYPEFSAPVPSGIMVAAGGSHSCALGYGGEIMIWCWGSNEAGQIDGHPSATSAEVRPAVETAGGVSSLSAGEAHTCSVVAANVVCWGSNAYGQRDPQVGAAVDGVSFVNSTGGAVEVAAGARHTCARFSTGKVACWGTLLDAEGRWTRVTAPTIVPGIETAAAITAGGGQTCARLWDDPAVLCWGANDSGQLGDGTTTSSSAPVVVRGVPRALALATGGTVEADGRAPGHTCVVDDDLHVSCWGQNGRGELGTGSGPDRTAPARVLAVPGGDPTDPTDLGGIVSIAAGAHHTCAIDDRGRASCWGDDTDGQLDSVPTPTPELFGRAVSVPRFSRRPAR